MKKWLVLLFSLVCSCAFTCDWTYFGSFVDEIDHFEYGNKCIHICENGDGIRHDYQMIFYTKGMPTGTIYYEGTTKEYSYIEYILSIYSNNNLSFREIMAKELNGKTETKNSNLTHLKMSLGSMDTNGNYSIFIFD